MQGDIENPYADAMAWEDIQTRERQEGSGSWVAPAAGHRLATRVQLVLIALTCVIGGIATAFEIEAIVVGGCVLSCLCAILFLHDWRCRSLGHQPNSWVRLIAVAGPIFAVGIVALIWKNNWSPNAADRVGVDEACCLFAFLTLIGAGLAYRKVPRTMLTD